MDIPNSAACDRQRIIGAEPFATKKFLEIEGRRMAYIDEGSGDTIVFQHGNPTSSYLWRNVMPYLRGLGRLIACDLIGMGDSDKLEQSESGRYHFEEQRRYLHELWEKLGLGERVVLVLHDWGSVLGFDWARRHPELIQGIVHMEAIFKNRAWTDFSDPARAMFQGFRSNAGEKMVLEENMFVERVLPSSIIRQLSDVEMTEYRRPFLNSGEGRRPTLSLPRDLPIEDEPAHMASLIEELGAFLATSDIPKLFINAEPGQVVGASARAFCRTWPNQIETTIVGRHFVQEDSPDEIGAAVATFVRRLRGLLP